MCKPTQQLPTLLAVAERLTGFKLCATTPNNTQLYKRTQHVTSNNEGQHLHGVEGNANGIGNIIFWQLIAPVSLKNYFQELLKTNCK